MKPKNLIPIIFAKINGQNCPNRQTLQINLDVATPTDGITTPNIASFAKYNEQTIYLPPSAEGLQYEVELIFNYIEETRGKLLMWAEGGESDPSIYDIITERYDEVFKKEIWKKDIQIYSLKERVNDEFLNVFRTIGNQKTNTYQKEIALFDMYKNEFQKYFISIVAGIKKLSEMANGNEKSNADIKNASAYIDIPKLWKEFRDIESRIIMCENNIKKGVVSKLDKQVSENLNYDTNTPDITPEMCEIILLIMKSYEKELIELNSRIDSLTQVPLADVVRI